MDMHTTHAAFFGPDQGKTIEVQPTPNSKSVHDTLRKPARLLGLQVGGPPAAMLKVKGKRVADWF